MSDLDLTSVEARASYGIGRQMGDQLTKSFDGVSLAATLAGIEDAFYGKNLRVDGEAIKMAFHEIQARIEDAQIEKEKEQAEAGGVFLQENAKREGVQVTASGLQYEVIEEGDGPKPSAESTVRTHYRGCFINGTEFDSSYERNEVAEFQVNGVIAGWTEALQMMNVGSKWKIYVPHDLAYGKNGAGGVIGPNETLVFDIELIDIL